VPNTLIPTFRYADANAAITFLAEAFGFERHVVYPDGTGGIAHAQLLLDGQMIMLGSVRDDAYGQHQRPPAMVGGVNTSALSIVTTTPDALYERALAAGATVVMAIEDWDHGGRGFTVADPEGYLWSFGSYDPWADVA